MTAHPRVLDFDSFEVMSFDCYGTLIDWESGILAALRPVLGRHGKTLSDEETLGLFAELEPVIQQGDYAAYRDVLGSVVVQIGRRLGFVPSVSEVACLANSVADWGAFPDTVEALHSLARRYKLAVISNTDDDLFASSAAQMTVDFEWAITAQQAMSYKPSLDVFQLALDIFGTKPQRVLHVGQSLYHDIAPARQLGMATVWVNRRRDREGSGATLAASVTPDLEVPDLKTLASLVALPAELQTGPAAS